MLKVVSFDIFQTLVDVNERIPQIWKAILQDQYTQELAQKGANMILQCYPEVISQALGAMNYFYTMDEVYMMCATKALEQLSYQVTARQIVDSLLYQHSQAPFYQDALSCIHILKEKYQVILSSDSNHRMVDELIPMIQPTYAFISDDLQSYKASKDGKFFQQVLAKMNISSCEMVHIGDSSHDIVGAQRANIPCIWLNRDNRIWKNEHKPDATITSLNELPEILTTLFGSIDRTLL